jgi:hypothetical protein
MNRFEGARIIDLAPTILYLLGEDIPQDMDGMVLNQIIADDFLSNNPVRLGSADDPENAVPQSGYNDEEETHIRDKLRGLGYID